MSDSSDHRGKRAGIAALALAAVLAPLAWAQSGSQPGQPTAVAQAGAGTSETGQATGEAKDQATGQATGEETTGQATSGQATGQEAGQDTGQAAGAAASDPAATAAGAGATASPADAPADSGTGPTQDAGADYVLGDVALGSADAPLTVYEYASFTCPHCAAFHEQTFPEFREKYIDTGKVRFILREVYFDQYGLWASMVARCGGEDGFYPLVDAFLGSQRTWTRAPDIGHAIQQVGRRAGLPAERLQECLSDRDFAKQLLETYQKNREADEVQSTPTFVINGENHTGAMSFEDFSAILDAAL